MFILKKFEINFMKGISPFVSMVLVIAFGFTAMTIVLTIVNPLLNQAKDSATVNEATQNMELIDSVIKGVASEAEGSKRTINIKISEGALRSNTSSEWVYFDFEPRTNYVLNGFSGDTRIESRSEYLNYFNHYSDGNTASDEWTSMNGTWSISSGRFLGTGGIAFHNFSKLQDFDYSVDITRSSTPDGQVFVIPGHPRDLVLFLPFDEGSGATAYDYSGYDNNGTLTNMNTTGNASSGWATGKFGNGTLFDGVDDNVNAGINTLFYLNTGLTVETWVNFNSVAVDQFITSYAWRRGNNEGSWALLLLSSKIQFDFYKAVGKDTFDTGLTPETNRFYHIAVTYNGTNVSIFIDGKLYVSSGETTAMQNYASSRLMFGAEAYSSIQTPSSSFKLNGTLDEVRIYNRSLSADEIAFEYEAGIKKITTAGEIPHIAEDANVSLVLSSPSSSYFDNVKVKSGGPAKIKFIVPYYKIDIENQVRFGPGDHKIVIKHNGTNTTNNKPLIWIGE